MEGAATDLETMVVKLVADASRYTKIIDAAEDRAVGMARAVDAEIARLGTVAERAANAAVVPIKRHTDALEDLKKAYSGGLLDSQYAYEKAALKEAEALEQARIAQAHMNSELAISADRGPVVERLTRNYQQAVADLRQRLALGIITADQYNARQEHLANVALPRVQAATEQYEQAQREAAEANRKAAQEVDRYNLAMQNQATAARNAVMQEGIAVTERARTATQVYEAEVMRLNGLLAAGAITQRTHTAAMAQAAGVVRGQMSTNLSGLSTVLGQVASTATRAGTALTALVTVPVAGFAAFATREFLKFDDNMNRAFAVAGEGNAELRRQLKETAITISNDSITSATQLSKVYYTLAQAGLDARQQQTALNIVNRFAVAGQMDVVKAGERLIDVQRTLGMESKDPLENAKSLTRVADVVMKASIMTQASAEDFARSLSTKVGAKARQFGKDIEEVTAALMAFASQGTKAELAGEQGYIVLRDLSTAATKNAEQWAHFGVSVYDAEENVRDVADIIEDLTVLMSGLSDKQKVEMMQMLGFKDRSSAATNTLLGLGEAMQGYEKALRSAGGETERVAKAIESSFLSELIKTWNMVRNLGIEIGEMLAPYLAKLNEYIRQGIAVWHSLSAEGKEWVVWLAAIAATAGPVLVVLGGLMSTVAGIAGSLTTLLALGPEVLAFLSGVAGTAALWAGWGVAIVAAIGVVVAAIYDPEHGLMNIVSGIGNMFTKAFHIAERVYSAFAGWLLYHGIPMLLNGMLRLFKAQVNFVMDMFVALKQALVDLFTGKFIDWAGLAARLGKGFAEGAGDANFINTVAKIYQEELGIEFFKAGEGAGKALEEGLAAATPAGAGAGPKAVAKATKDMSAEIKTMSKDGIEAREELNKLIEKEKMLAATYGMTARQVLIWRMAQAGAGPEILAAARADDERLTGMERGRKLLEDSVKRTEQMEERARALAEKHASPFEKIAKEQEEVRDLFDMGLISLEAYNAEMEELNEKVHKLEGEKKVKIKLEGLDAAEAGTAEAIKRIDQYRQHLKREVEKSGNIPAKEATAAGIMLPGEGRPSETSDFELLTEGAADVERAARFGRLHAEIARRRAGAPPPTPTEAAPPPPERGTITDEEAYRELVDAMNALVEVERTRVGMPTITIEPAKL